MQGKREFRDLREGGREREGERGGGGERGKEIGRRGKGGGEMVVGHRAQRQKDRDGGRREPAPQGGERCRKDVGPGGRQRDGSRTQRKSPSSPRPPHSCFALWGAPPEFCWAPPPRPPPQRALPARRPLLGVVVEQASPEGGLRQTGKGPGATLLGDPPRAPVCLLSLSQAGLGTHLGAHLGLGSPQLPPALALTGF